ncbi:hypothetical protein [Nostoc sp.]
MRTDRSALRYRVAGAVVRKYFAPLHWAHLEGVFAQAPALLKGSMKPFQPYIWSKLSLCLRASTVFDGARKAIAF